NAVAINKKRQDPPPPTTPTFPTQYYYDQKLDHFNDTNTETFKQTYYFNSSFYKAGGPIFIHTAGEARAQPIYVFSTGISELVASLNGLLVTIEHRFYGDSYPPSITDLSFDNIKNYLTIDQSLNDFVNFIKNPPAELAITDNAKAKWVFVGGSYAGNLAVWMRKLYPDVVFASYASSAPLLAKLDFFEYDQSIAKALSKCSQQVADVFKLIDPILLSGNDTAILELKKLFGLQDLVDNSDFASALSSPISDMVQYYLPASPSFPIDTIKVYCDAFNQAPATTTPFEIFVQLTNYYFQLVGLNTTEAILKKFSTTDSLTLKIPNDLTSYTFQYCTELGYFQVAPKPPLLSLRSQLNNNTYFQGQCNYLFPTLPPPNVNKTNEKFGGNDGVFSNTVFVNGDLDPWFALTVKNLKDNKVFIIKNGSHTNDLNFPTPSDSQSLIDSRVFVKETLSKWLNVKN
ncbi:8280_t:CDS:1, partial [Entrophospora sp. SA101]